MKVFKKIIKMILLTVLTIVAIGAIGTVIFVNTSPQFGGKSNKEQKLQYAKLDYYKDGKFQNHLPTPMNMTFSTFMSIMRDYMKGGVARKPKGNIPVEKIDSLDIVHYTDTVTRLTWFGHSSFLLEIDDKNILLDPMLGESPSPLPALGSKRYYKELPIEIEKIPMIDAVIFSHDHYDHLDYGSILKLKDKVGAFYVPLGLGAHLKEWGVAESKIHELEWWEEAEFKGLKFACTPSRHFSGRGLSDRFETLWSSWVIQGARDNIYFSGDSGYGPHFTQIGDKYGPFDLAMMECGQYDDRWSNIHMMPEETAQAGIDVRAKLVMPIHWGAFTLALHSWTDPIERVTVKARELGLSLTTPKIGQPLILSEDDKPNLQWWKDVD